jgi:hypothetical protein
MRGFEMMSAFWSCRGACSIALIVPHERTRPNFTSAAGSMMLLN